MGTLGNVPIRVKAAVVDKFVAIRRIKEEMVLLIQEMTNFMTFYRDNILPKLREQDSQIRHAIGRGMYFLILLYCPTWPKNLLTKCKTTGYTFLFKLCVLFTDAILNPLEHEMERAQVQ